MLLTSLNEGTPVTIIESLVSGVPVIASDVGGVKDIINIWNSDMLVKEHDISSFVEKILACSGSDMCVDESIQNKIKEKFSIKRLIKDIEYLYST